MNKVLHSIIVRRRHTPRASWSSHNEMASVIPVSVTTTPLSQEPCPAKQGPWTARLFGGGIRRVHVFLASSRTCVGWQTMISIHAGSRLPCEETATAEMSDLPLVVRVLINATTHHLTSPHLASRHVTSRHVTSRHVPSRPVPSRPVPSRPVTSPHVTSRHVTSRHVTSRHNIS